VKKIVFVTPPDAQYGFNLAGIDQVVTERDGVPRAFLDVIGDPEVGMVAIDERLLGTAAQQQAEQTKWPGIIAVLPAPEKAAPAEDYAMQVIRRAVGYQVRLNL